jgi:c-di-GMP-binding flagellar brake protein YcgR
MIFRKHTPKSERWMKPNRRKYERFQVKKDTLFVFNHFSTCVGNVLDICENGISFEYKNEAGAENGHEVIDIFSLNDGKHYLGSVQCRTIYSNCADRRSENSSKERQLCRCGLQFSDMSSQQKEMLEKLLQKSTHFINDSSPYHGDQR